MATVTKPIILDETGQDIVAALQTIASHAAGLVGQGVPSGGTTGQVLKKKSNTDYDTEWGAESSVSPYTSNPAMDGTASAGSATEYARGDHVHPSDTSKANKVTLVSVLDSGAVSKALDIDKFYLFLGSLTSLTITLNPGVDIEHYHFSFESGSSAPTLAMPVGVVMPSGFQVEANKHYEVDVLQGYAVVQSW